MLDFILGIDSSLFHVLNGILISESTDIIFTFLTSVKNTWPLYLSIALYIAFKHKRNGIIAVLSLALSIGIADQVSTHILKPTFNRERPCRQEENVRSLIPCGPGQSFPSTHAINNGCIAMFIGLLFPQLRMVIIIFAFLVSYSRIYVGVHYPLDIVGGLLLGSLIGLVSAKVVHSFLAKLESNHQTL